MTPLKALAEAFGAIGQLPFWPGDPVRVYGEPRTYVRRACGFHIVVTDEGRQQVCPPDSVSRRGR